MPSWDVFLSHSAVDKDFVRRLAVDLGVYGYTAWLDEDHLRIGSALTPALRAAIEDSRFVAVVHSPSSADSLWVKQEREYALLRGVPVIPIVLDRAVVAGVMLDQVFADFTLRDDQHAYHRALHDVLIMLGHPTEPPERLQIYACGLSRGWRHSSWDARCSDPYDHDDGPCLSALLFPFGGVAFEFRSGINTTPYSGLEFRLHGGREAGQRIKVFVNDRIGNGVRTPIQLDPLPDDGWHTVTLPLTGLDANDTIIFKVNWSHVSGEISGPIYLNDVALVR